MILATSRPSLFPYTTLFRSMAEVAQLDTLVGQELGRAGRRAIDDVAGGDVDLVASHGQTVYHWVVGARARGTLQLGNRSEEHTSELQSRENLVCRLLLEKKTTAQARQR